MKSSIRWIVFGVLLGLISVAAYRIWWLPRERIAGYRGVSRALCARFAADAAAKGQEMGLMAKGMAPVIVSPIGDSLLQEAAAARDHATRGASAKVRGETELRYIDDVLQILAHEAPEFVALCDKLTSVYVACDEFSTERDRFRVCVEEKQRPVVSALATWLFRNASKQ